MGQLASVIGGRLAKILADDDQETRTVSACSYYVLRSNRWQSLMLGRGSRLLIVLALGFSILPACTMLPMGWTGRQAGLASWYGPGFYGRHTASGVVYTG